MEAWHRKIKSLLGMAHPSIFKFIQGLVRSQKLRDAEFELLLAGRPQRARRTIYVARDARIRTIVTDDANRQIIEYLRGLAHNIRH